MSVQITVTNPKSLEQSTDRKGMDLADGGLNFCFLIGGMTSDKHVVSRNLGFLITISYLKAFAERR